ncbi:hypothetical protein [Fibrella aquatica]|jgi:hypothetical protein|uniref:hypothetical protein n=1 Tax=Fibrella aquatica TaxID=3242487 RepID=UPI003521BA83
MKYMSYWIIPPILVLYAINKLFWHDTELGQQYPKALSHTGVALFLGWQVLYHFYLKRRYGIIDDGD